MGNGRGKLRHVMDWRAALWAGLIAGAAFLVSNMLLTEIFLGSPWVAVRLTASVLLGPDVLPPPATFDGRALAVAILVHFPLSVLFACLVALILHRWGMVAGLFGGAACGLALYAIHFYTLSFLFPWFYPMRGWLMAASHALFGAVAGVVYEALELERPAPAGP